MKRHLHSFMIGAALAALCIAPAHALEYSFDAPPDYLFGQSTSDTTIYAWENPNVDRSKDVALAAPGFGTPTSYLPYSGEYLTPNLVSGALSGEQAGLGVAVGNSGALPAGNVPAASTVVAGATVETSSFPTLDAPSVQNIAFTEVTPDFYYPNGSLGTLKIPSIGLTVGVYQGTTSDPLLKGAGHFTDTSIWAGNVAIAGHNRGVRNDFGKLHTLNAGDLITLTTALGTRTYAVNSVSKISVNDTSGLSPTAGNCITLYTCVEDQPAYRWCVRGIEV